MNHKWKIFSCEIKGRKHFGFEIMLNSNERVATPVVEVDDYGDEMDALNRLCRATEGTRHERLEEDSSLSLENARVDAPAVASPNSTRDVVAGCISRLVGFLHSFWGRQLPPKPQGLVIATSDAVITIALLNVRYSREKSGDLLPRACENGSSAGFVWMLGRFAALRARSSPPSSGRAA